MSLLLPKPGRSRSSPWCDGGGSLFTPPFPPPGWGGAGWVWEGKAADLESRPGKTGAGRALGIRAEPILRTLGLPGVKTHNPALRWVGRAVLHRSVPAPPGAPRAPPELPARVEGGGGLCGFRSCRRSSRALGAILERRVLGWLSLSLGGLFPTACWCSRCYVNPVRGGHGPPQIAASSQAWGLSAAAEPTEAACSGVVGRGRWAPLCSLPRALLHLSLLQAGWLTAPGGIPRSAGANSLLLTSA